MSALDYALASALSSALARVGVLAARRPVPTTRRIDYKTLSVAPYYDAPFLEVLSATETASNDVLLLGVSAGNFGIQTVVVGAGAAGAERIVGHVTGVGTNNGVRPALTPVLLPAGVRLAVAARSTTNAPGTANPMYVHYALLE